MLHQKMATAMNGALTHIILIFVFSWFRRSSWIDIKLRMPDDWPDLMRVWRWRWRWMRVVTWRLSHSVTHAYLWILLFWNSFLMRLFNFDASRLWAAESWMAGVCRSDQHNGIEQKSNILFFFVRALKCWPASNNNVIAINLSLSPTQTIKSYYKSVMRSSVD